MFFKDVIGQDSVKNRLIAQFREGRQPHALLLSGPEGCGKLSMAVALANYLLCQHPGETDSCGECPACKQINKFGHPDLHFSFPFIKKSETTTCEDYLPEWHEMTSNGFYFGINDWLEMMGAENKQALITDAESDNILEKLSLSSYSGGYKVMILWLPERLHISAANNLLKFLEEPTPKTVFILVSQNPAMVLPTILSRTQQIEMSRLPQDVITEALEKRNGLDHNTAIQIARSSNGSYLKALRQININDENKVFFEDFVTMMRLAYSRDIRKMQKWADNLASYGRERQKDFLEYSQNMLRENFIYNFHRPELNSMTDEEAKFALKFASFINERNVKEFMKEFTHAQRDVEQNVNAKTLFFDFILKITILIRK